METLEIKGISFKRNKVILDFFMNIKDDETNDTIELSIYYNAKSFISQKDNYFEAFQYLKDQLLEEENIGLQCYGSMENVYPSPMMRNTQKAYCLKLGEQARSANIVNIFDYVDISKFATTKEQHLFYDKWIKSLQ